MDALTFTRLQNEYDILYLLQVRSKNQHRQQHWFKYLNLTSRNLRKILKLQIDIDRLDNGTKVSKLGYKKQQIQKLARSVVKISKSAYFAYESILVLGQYLTLGFALLGNLAAIVHLLGEIPGVRVGKYEVGYSLSRQAGSTAGGVEAGAGGDLDDDFGEEIPFDEQNHESEPELEHKAELGSEMGAEASKTTIADQVERTKVEDKKAKRRQYDTMNPPTSISKKAKSKSSTSSHASETKDKMGSSTSAPVSTENVAVVAQTSRDENTSPASSVKSTSAMSIDDIFGSSKTKNKKKKGKKKELKKVM
ncbi:uncharacterized protein LODBEIA_P15160 [Lodderomyces beijingensis]|uniref:RNase MRP protein 1 RNA binding domain-containing protein n=1 Tax=Lodderomyces beijingensis TaxID=1775926 RepID=A0ABP0ZM65_9ASCO